MTYATLIQKLAQTIPGEFTPENLQQAKAIEFALLASSVNVGMDIYVRNIVVLNSAAARIMTCSRSVADPPIPFPIDTEGLMRYMDAFEVNIVRLHELGAVDSAKAWGDSYKQLDELVQVR